MSTLKARMAGNPTVRIRAARMSDLDALVELENRSFTTDRMSRRQWRRHLVSASACVLVAQADQPMAGAAIVFFRKNSTIARLYSLAVDTGLRGLGIGELLLAACEAQALARKCLGLRLEVRTDNTAAQQLYLKRGYHSIGELSDYYEDGAPALRLEISLRSR